MGEIISLPKVDFIGLSISIFTKEELIAYIERVIRLNEFKIFYGYSIGLLPILKQYPNLIKLCNDFDLLVTDGRAFYSIAKFFDTPLKYDISIPNMVLEILKLANLNQYKVLLFGAKDEINKQATLNLKEKYPNAKILDGISGYYDKNREEIIVKKISIASPDILLIGTPSPMKEEFAYKYKQSLNSKIIIPCGGMIDVLAGVKRITPIWLKKMGFAWLYRYMQQPIIRFQLTIDYISLLFFKLLPILVLKKVGLIKTQISIPKLFGSKNK